MNDTGDSHGQPIVLTNLEKPVGQPIGLSAFDKMMAVVAIGAVMTNGRKVLSDLSLDGSEVIIATTPNANYRENDTHFICVVMETNFVPHGDSLELSGKRSWLFECRKRRAWGIT